MVFLEQDNQKWKTFVKKPQREVASYETTDEELEKARLKKIVKGPSRSPDSIIPVKELNFRGNRAIVGDFNAEFEDPNRPIPMSNKVSSDWKEKLGLDLMRFQPEETKVLVKNEMSLIKIAEGKGRYFEQVIVTFLMKDGEQSSFRALVDSETGVVEATWDRTIHERYGKQKEKIPFPPAGISNITTR